MNKTLKAIQNYLRDAVAEMKKVVWPNKKQTVNYTIIVIAMSIGIAIFFGIIDYIFNLGLEQIIR